MANIEFRPVQLNIEQAAQLLQNAYANQQANFQNLVKVGTDFANAAQASQDQAVRDYIYGLKLEQVADPIAVQKSIADKFGQSFFGYDKTKATNLLDKRSDELMQRSINQNELDNSNINLANSRMAKQDKDDERAATNYVALTNHLERLSASSNPYDLKQAADLSKLVSNIKASLSPVVLDLVDKKAKENTLSNYSFSDRISAANSKLEDNAVNDVSNILRSNGYNDFAILGRTPTKEEETANDQALKDTFEYIKKHYPQYASNGFLQRVLDKTIKQQADQQKDVLGLTKERTGIEVAQSNARVNQQNADTNAQRAQTADEQGAARLALQARGQEQKAHEATQRSNQDKSKAIGFRTNVFNSDGTVSPSAVLGELINISADSNNKLIQDKAFLDKNGKPMTLQEWYASPSGSKVITELSKMPVLDRRMLEAGILELNNRRSKNKQPQLTDQDMMHIYTRAVASLEDPFFNPNEKGLLINDWFNNTVTWDLNGKVADRIEMSLNNYNKGLRDGSSVQANQRVSTLIGNMAQAGIDLTAILSNYDNAKFIKDKGGYTYLPQEYKNLIDQVIADKTKDKLKRTQETRGYSKDKSTEKLLNPNNRSSRARRMQNQKRDERIKENLTSKKK
ncbi:hypothetical protein ACF3NV_07865 [Moraxella atlantae]|uniref:hypothetical protein n=1 Tax=Faucicola atlantae TaxID=34059 RepID=UPI003752A46B